MDPLRIEKAIPELPQAVVQPPSKKIPKNVIDASVFLRHLRGRDFDRFPGDFSRELNEILADWGDSPGDSGEDFVSMLVKATKKIEAAKMALYTDNFDSPDYARMALKVLAHPPLEIPIERPYKVDELADKFPPGNELQQHLGKATFSICFELDRTFYLVDRPDGRRQRLEIVKTERQLNEIVKDLQEAPEILPQMETYRLKDGSTVLLTEWVKGVPVQTEEEQTLCHEAVDSLLVVPVEQEDLGQGKYDFNITNFRIATDDKGNERAYYIDGDIPHTIVQLGLHRDVPEKRKTLLGNEKAVIERWTLPKLKKE